MPDAAELLHMNLRVFSERDPEKRRAAIERTYVEDVRFIDPDGERVGREALNDRAQKILDDAPADFVLEEDGLAYVHRTAGAPHRTRGCDRDRRPPRLAARSERLNAGALFAFDKSQHAPARSLYRPA